MINSVAFATYEPGLATQQVRNNPDNFLGIIGQAVPSNFQTPVVAVAVVLGLLLLLEHSRIRFKL